MLARPRTTDGAHHSYWMYAIEFNTSAGLDRDEVIAAMAERNIETRPGFYPTHTMPPYFDPLVSTPIADEIGRNTLCLPTHALLTEDDVDYIVEQLRDVMANAKPSVAFTA